MIQALIFDFDGLILDTELPEFQTWQEIHQEHGVYLPLSAWAAGIGTVGGFDPYAYLESLLGRPVEREKLRTKVNKRWLDLIALQEVLPGVKAYLMEAKRLGLKIGLASSSSHAWVEGYLNRHGLLDFFEGLKCSDDVKKVKPDPELYLAVLEGLNVRPAEAIALEDSPNGIRAARQAGLYCVAIPNALTRGLSLEIANFQLTSLEEIPLEQLLKKIG